MEQKGYRSLSIASLATSSDMSRSNLYRYFTNKREIFNAVCDDLFDEFYAEMEQNMELADTFELQPVIKLIYVILGSNASKLRLLLDCNENDMFYLRCRQYIRRIIGHYALANEVKITDADYISLVTDHISGSLYHVFVSWLEGGMKYTPAQLASMHATLIRPGLLGENELQPSSTT